jgi:hypothetical protein
MRTLLLGCMLALLGLPALAQDSADEQALKLADTTRDVSTERARLRVFADVGAQHSSNADAASTSRLTGVDVR